MKYPTSPLTPFLATLLCIRRRMHILSEQREPKDLDQLSAHTPIACALLNSLASLFPLALVCFQSFADSFCKTPGGGGTPRLSRLPRSSRGHLPLVYPELLSERGHSPLPCSFLFIQLQIPVRANPFFSHPYKT